MTLDNSHSRLADDPAMPRPGDILDGRYRIEDVLGEGGFAAVFRATDAKTGKAFAVKVLDPMMSRRDEFRRRFFLEIANSSKLNHVNTIHVSDQGETESGCLYLVMELLEGQSLDDLLHDRGPMPARLVRSVAMQTLRSLREAHNVGLLHRDIKPANIFIVENATDGDDVFVKVVDFGIAKSMDSANDAALTSTGQVMCSPHYVAPERVIDHETFPSSDLYSLGISMIEMLEGKPPYDGENTIQLVMMHARMDDAVPMGENTLNSPLVDVIRRATHKDHSQRYQSADEMLDALRAVQGPNASAPTPDPLAAYREEIDALPTPPAWRQGAYSSIAAVVLVILIILMVGFTLWRMMDRKSDAEPQQTVAEQQETQDSAASEKNAAQPTPDDDEAIGTNGVPQPPHTLQSDPKSAEVFFDGTAQGRTPHAFEENDLPDMPFELRLALPDGREHQTTIRNLSDLEGRTFAISADSAPTDQPSKDSTSSSAPSKPRASTSSGNKDTPKPSQDAQEDAHTSASDDEPHKDADDAPNEEAVSAPPKPSKPRSSSDSEPAAKPNAAEDALERIRSGSGGGYGSSRPSGGYTGGQ